MFCSRCIRRLMWAALAVLLAWSSDGFAQSQKPRLLKPDQTVAAASRRLILKDGTYQVVRKYEIAGDRVRYISMERGGDWEELPVDLVDWEATRKWERDQASHPVQEISPGMEEAAEIDREEAAERVEQQSRRPTVAKGLTLPDQDAVFALDSFEGAPELVELVPVDLDMNAKSRHGLNTLNPLAGAKTSLELEGQHARVHLHTNVPVLYLALGARDDAEEVLSHALTVQTGGAKELANRKHGAHSPASGFAIVRVDVRQAVRIVGAIHTSPSGAATQEENVIPATAEILPGKHWMKLTPSQPLADGEYALVEIISASEINQSVWDFRVDPQSGDNPGSLGPILK